MTRYLRKLIPTRQQVMTERKYRLVRSIANKPYLWHFRRHAVARGFAMGAFWSPWPVVGQFIPCILITARWRGSLPVAFAALWISNPFTIIPFWWTAYHLGRLVLGTPPANIPITWEYLRPRINSLPNFLHFISANFHDFYIPVFVGSLLQGAAIGILGYFLINRIWKARTRRKWKISRARAAQHALQPA